MQMNDEKLIELVKENTVLYDVMHPKYMDPKYKLFIWQSIGNQLSCTGPQCKSRWTNIRDHFRRHLQKRKSMSSEDIENRKRYKYEEHLQFLLPYSNDKDTKVPFHETSPVPEFDTFKSTTPDVHTDDETNLPHTSPSFTKKSFQNRNNVGRSQISTNASNNSQMFKYLLDKNDPENVTDLPLDDIDTFLIGIASTLKKLSPYNQHVAKGHIFNIVHDLEAKEFFDQSP